MRRQPGIAYGLARWVDSASERFVPVISTVLSRPSAVRRSCRSLAIFRLRREGTDPALRGPRSEASHAVGQCQAHGRKA